MTDAERAALERYRRQLPVDGYGRSDEVECTELFLPTQEYEDKCILANLALREHPADEGEKITEEWLLSIGFKKGSSPRARPLYCDCVTFESVERGVVSICDFTESAILNTKFTTRGDVYRLLRALGIEVKG